eukprot:c25065_g1_i3 orf=297-1841(-)
MACCDGQPPVQVSLLGREMVVPAKPTKRHNFFLSCLDIFWQDMHYNQRLIFYESTPACFTEDGQPGVALQKGSDGRSAVMEKLKSSLALCLVHYYCWCGRIAKGGEPDRRLFIDCNDAGVEFVEAYLDLPISHLAKDGYQMKPIFEQLCQHPDHKGDCLYSSPLLSIQGTLFSDGGLALGIAQSHMVADGQSLWNFMVSWGECSRGVPLSLPPVHKRELLAVPDPSPEKATWIFETETKDEDNEEEETDSSLGEKGDVKTNSSLEDKDINVGLNPSTNGNKESSEASLGSESQPDPLVQCFFDLSSSAVKKLKGEAGQGYTSYEVTCAHFWQRLDIARREPSLDPTRFAVLGNFRTRLTPPLPPAYFGNVISFGVTLSRVHKICTETLGATASRIHEAIVSMKEGLLVGFMHWLETHDNRMIDAYVSSVKGKSLNVASSPRFPVYQVDFGWGKPVAVRPVKVRGDGEFVFFGGRPGSIQGDMEICTALPATVLRRLLKDPLFLAKPPCSPFAEE